MERSRNVALAKHTSWEFFKSFDVNSSSRHDVWISLLSGNAVSNIPKEQLHNSYKLVWEFTWSPLVSVGTKNGQRGPLFLD